MDKPKVAGEVDAYCSRCDLDLAHTVVAMVGEQVVQARCNTCGAFHRYRAPKSAAAAKRAAAATRRKTAAGGTRAAGGRGTAKAAGWEADWDNLVAKAGDAPIRPYRPALTFEQGELVQHAKFGLGVVQALVSDSKVSILFKTGLRTLIMNRG